MLVFRGYGKTIASIAPQERQCMIDNLRRAKTMEPSMIQRHPQTMMLWADMKNLPTWMSSLTVGELDDDQANEKAQY